MKNIFVFSSQEQTRLQLNSLDKLFLSQEPKSYLDCINQNIYITNNEEIKAGDCCLDLETNKLFKAGLSVGCEYKDFFKKIILTTDFDLIKNGVQAIDDEFLEWFVKNSSCEWVNISSWSNHENKKLRVYKPTIPQEPKPFKDMFPITQVDWSSFNKTTKKQVGYIEPKQETIEEVALKEYPVYMHYGEATVLHDGNEEQREAFIDGWNKCLKHQSEKMFSEEEVLDQLNILMKMPSSELDTFTDENNMITKKWFNKFKK